MKRRHFLTASAAFGAAILTGATPSLSAPADPLQRLKEGNRRFMKAMAAGPLDLKSSRAQLTQGQSPFATILGCADSRVPPEMVFDQGLGDLFVVRVAGNLADDDNHAVMGSIEYGSLVLGSKLIVVLGHTSCGAVSGAIQKLDGGDRAPASIGYLVNSIKPAVEQARTQGKDGLLDRSIETNVRMELERLKKNTILADLAKKGKLALVGGVYQLKTGEVKWLGA